MYTISRVGMLRSAIPNKLLIQILCILQFSHIGRSVIPNKLLIQ